MCRRVDYVNIYTWSVWRVIECVKMFEFECACEGRVGLVGAGVVFYISSLNTNNYTDF